jgi:hypothetical protein
MKFAGTKATTEKWMAEICSLLSSKKYFIRATKSRENFSVIHIFVIVLLKKLVPLDILSASRLEALRYDIFVVN